MRPIKFRAWDERNQKMSKMLFDISSMDAIDRLYFTVHGTADKEARPPETLKWMQFTGLTDKNGREIYEGDVVVDAWRHKQKVEIGPIYHASHEDTFAGYGFGFDTHDLEDFKTKVEVIGNIYENPELLKQN